MTAHAPAPSRACRRALACLLLPLAARALGAQAAPSPAPAGPVPAHDTFTVRSRALDEPRRVNVWVPPAYRASRGARLPVLYMPDGGLDEDFPHVVDTVDSLVARGAIRPVIVVGVPNTQRRRDLTGPTRLASDSAIAPRVGGAAAFRRFLRDELVPAIEARYRTTGERAIIGESLAGLFVVETFLEEPTLFTHYVALDPSVWWNGGALLDAAPARLAALDGRARTLYLASSDTREIAAGTARLDSLLRAARPRGLAWSYHARPDLTHATIFRAAKPAALVRALGALAAPPPDADSTVALYCAAWGTADRAARDRILERVWAPDGTYSDPAPTHAVGRAALGAAIERLRQQIPGARFRCSGAQTHHGFLRFTWALLAADGAERLRGMDFGELDADGRLRRIVGFFGAPPEPR